MNVKIWIPCALACFALGCEPKPAPLEHPASSVSALPAPVAPSASGLSSSPPVQSSAAASPPVVASSAASSTPPPLPPCPPEVAPPPDALAWVSGCAILIAKPIVFEFDKDRIRPESYAVLDVVGDILNKESSFVVEIQGHRDKGPGVVRAREITRDRAESVKRYLIEKKGVDPKRLISKGYGETKPIALSDTEEGRKKNRRIEFVLLSHQRP